MAQGKGAGRRISEALRKAGLKPVDLARALKVSQPTVHNWVNEAHGITWANARRVAEYLKVSPGWIMFGSDEEAERVAQTAEEFGFLRLYRELDDAGQAAILRLMDAMKIGGSLIAPAKSEDQGPDTCVIDLPSRRASGNQ